MEASQIAAQVVNKTMTFIDTYQDQIAGHAFFCFVFSKIHPHTFGSVILKQQDVTFKLQDLRRYLSSPTPNCLPSSAPNTSLRTKMALQFLGRLTEETVKVSVLK